MLNPAKINEYNSLLLRWMSKYINNYADFIKPDMINKAMQDCGIGKEEAFRILVSGITDVFENRDIMNYYIKEMMKLLDVGVYKNDPYYKTIKLGDIRSNNWSIEQRKFSPYEAFVFNDLVRKPDGRIIPQIGFFDTEYRYPCILQSGREWMLITPNEIETMKKPLADARGDVLTYGLGLGYFAFMAASKSDVNHVTIVDNAENVIRLFKEWILPQFPCGDKITIINADAFEYAKLDARYDFVFADIWHDPSDGVELYLRFKELEHPGIQYAYWIEDTIKCYI